MAAPSSSSQQQQPATEAAALLGVVPTTPGLFQSFGASSTSTKDQTTPKEAQEAQHTPDFPPCRGMHGFFGRLTDGLRVSEGQMEE